jgi:hypothetical protein
MLITTIILHGAVTQMGTRWSSWLRQRAVSIPDYVIGIFHSHNPSVRTMALGSIQLLTERSHGNISWVVKAVGV